MATIAASIGINIAKWGIPADTGAELDFDGDTTGTSCALCVSAANGEIFVSLPRYGAFSEPEFVMNNLAK
ncbi:hypothetical protein EGC79_20080 [Shewanella vesiculosa]|uniref:hypothetical protein n=1 Tax=Shewanella vesiculosa TaxID=518738 RepID=UPI000FB1B77A|nr:hypothetical protein [Shewanella vesiculosa]RPA33886.1 hypothetical protein EGC79_20080 [Shewanella vesiculosa]UJL44747.1 hypothetical protein KDH10_001288 [Shewanella vesiculosa]